MPKRTDRRSFLRVAGLSGAVFLLNACAPAAAPSPTAAPAKAADKPTEAPKPAGAPSPGASPAAAASPAASPVASPAASPAAKPAAPASSAAATPPPGPIEVVVAAGAGGSTDVLARRVAEILNREQIVTQTLLVQPRPGGSGAVGYQYVAEKRGDPNVVSFFGQSYVTTPIARGSNPAYYQLIPPVAHLMLADLIVCTSANNPNFKTFAEMIDYSRKNPGQVKLGGAQVGSTDHIVASLIDKAAGTQITYVGFNAGAEAIPQVLGGTLDLVVLNPDEAADMSEAGEIRQLAILTEQRVRHRTAGQVPTAREQGYNVVYDQVWGLALPPNSSPGLVAWWDQVTAKLVQSQAYRDFLDENAFRDHYLNSAQAPAFLKQKHDEHVKIMTDLGLAR